MISFDDYFAKLCVLAKDFKEFRENHSKKIYCTAMASIAMFSLFALDLTVFGGEYRQKLKEKSIKRMGNSLFSLKNVCLNKLKETDALVLFVLSVSAIAITVILISRMSSPSLKKNEDSVESSESSNKDNAVVETFSEGLADEYHSLSSCIADYASIRNEEI